VGRLAATGLRSGEAVSVEVSDVDLAFGTLRAAGAKGGKDQIVSCRSARRPPERWIRYLRARRQHPLADTFALWLGDRGRRFTYDALYRTLVRRAELLKLQGFHPDGLRHTAATAPLPQGARSGKGMVSVACSMENGQSERGGVLRPGLSDW
jgi:integrase/recombinase XerD